MRMFILKIYKHFPFEDIGIDDLNEPTIERVFIVPKRPLVNRCNRCACVINVIVRRRSKSFYYSPCTHKSCSIARVMSNFSSLLVLTSPREMKLE